MLDLTTFSKAINSMNDLVEQMENSEEIKKLNPTLILGLRAGVMQKFEFTYEIAWKYMKRWLENNVGASIVDGVARRQLFRLAFENGLINDIDSWMDYHNGRNRTSHTYNLVTADEVYVVAIKFLPDVKILYKVLEEKND